MWASLGIIPEPFPSLSSWGRGVSRYRNGLQNVNILYNSQFNLGPEHRVRRPSGTYWKTAENTSCIARGALKLLIGVYNFRSVHIAPLDDEHVSPIPRV